MIAAEFGCEEIWSVTLVKFLQYANCFQTQTTRNGITAQLTFVGAERLATATQQSCTKVHFFIVHKHIVSCDIDMGFLSVCPSVTFWYYV